MLVEHEHFVEFTQTEEDELEKLVGPGGEAEGMVLMTGAEGRADVSWGEHINYINNCPDIQIACHPNWGPAGKLLLHPWIDSNSML